MRIGIDVGGTNTDAVLMDGPLVVATAKCKTSADVTTGVVASIRELLSAGEGLERDVQAVMIGTTHFTNAFIEGKHLASVAAVRLGLPATKSFPPMIDWPEPARATLHARGFLCHGGNEFDGRPISALDVDELLGVAQEIREEGLESIAISSVFSPSTPAVEREAAAILGAVLPGLPISLSHEIGRLGLLERENATIINASLRNLSARIVQAFHDAVAAFGIDAPVYLSQNDGTLGTLEFTQQYPVATFTSGPTNSMRGAGFLSGEMDCIVVDIGGTTADIGVLQNGFPRESAVDARVGGVRTNFRLPDVVSLGIGGGSVVSETGKVGPRSVGYAITSEALVFGGSTLTATDLAVAGGLATIGDPTLLGGVDPAMMSAALESIEIEIADAIDAMRRNADPLAVVLVGGGSIILRDEIEGVDRVIRPDHFGVANAVGAAIAQLGTTYECVVDFSEEVRDHAVHEAMEEARRRTVDAGADPSTVRIVDIEEISVAYLPGNSTRIKVKAVGDLKLKERDALPL